MNCKYLEEMCKETCKVNERGVHTIFYNGKTGIFKLDREGHPAGLLGQGLCPRYVLLYYLDHPGNLERNLMNAIKEHSPDIVIYSPDCLMELLELANMFGFPKPVEDYIGARLKEIAKPESC